MFHSLRWKIIGAFSFTILLTIILSGILAVWMTTSRFEMLITTEGQYLAEEIAPLLEASYAISGNWDNLEEIFTVYPESAPPPELFETTWYGSVDWLDVAARTIGMDVERLTKRWENGESIASIAQSQDVDPNDVIEAIVSAEEASIQVELKNGEITPEEFDGLNLWTKGNVETFVYDLETSFSSEIPADVTWSEESIGWLLNTFLLGSERLLVTDNDGIVVYDSSHLSNGEPLSDDMLKWGASLWDYTTNEPIGTVIVASDGYYNPQQQAFLNSVKQSLLLSGLIAGAIALLVGLLFAKKITSPVVALTEATHHIADGHWDERLPINSDDELGKMSAAFNAMAESLEAQRALRNRLVDDITHELNTPLSVIQLELEALNDGMQTPDDASTHVKREINLLENLVSDLTLLTDFGEGKLHLDKELTDIEALARNAISRWQAQADAKKITLSLEIPESLPQISIDPRRITQVLGNLIANALHYTPEGGKINIRLTPSDHGSILFTVRDTGIGIAHTDLPHIFDRFYRADYARSRHTGGRGLGLAIAKEIVELHGGHIWAESILNEGSLFGFELDV